MVTALAEICDTQAAMSLLGFESEVSSHKFVYLHVWSAVGYQNRISFKTHANKNEAHENKDAVPTGNHEYELQENEDDNQNEIHMHELEANTNEIGDADTTGKQEFADTTGKQEFESELRSFYEWMGNKRTMYVSHDGEAHAISQHELYMHRVENWDMTYTGPPDFTDDRVTRKFETSRNAWKTQARIEQQCGLKDLSLLQFVIHIMVKKIPSSGEINALNTHVFRFNKQCPLYGSHYLQLRRKPCVPILAGKTRPPPPGHDKPAHGNARRQWESRANQFARYMGTIIFPWNRIGDCGVHNWNQFQQKVMLLKESHHDRESSWKRNLYRDAFHLQYLNNVASNMRCAEKVQRMSHTWGSEFAQRFSRDTTNWSKDPTNVDQTCEIASTIEDIRSLLDQAAAKQMIDDAASDASKTTQFLENMSENMDDLYYESDSIRRKIKPDLTESTQWRRNVRKYTKTWADKERSALNKDQELSVPIRDTNTMGKRRHLSATATRKLNEIRSELDVNKEWLRVFDHVIKTWCNGQQLLLFIHGGPGTGKTTLAKAIMKAASIFSLEHRFAATSGIAGLLNGGTTIHHLLVQNGELSSSKPNVNKIRLRNGNAHVIFIDEVMVWDIIVTCLARPSVLTTCVKFNG